MKQQKFYYGDLVKVADDLGPMMRHFRSGGEAIIMGSYNDKYGDGTGQYDETREEPSYGLLFTDSRHESSWYYESQLTFIKHAGGAEIHRIKREAQDVSSQQQSLAWIVSNWPNIRAAVPGPSMAKLMSLIGIYSPWGRHGEGTTYFQNALFTSTLLDPVLSTGDLVFVEHFIAQHRHRNGLPECS